MFGLSTLLETARRALSSEQIGMAITSHNIANASTTGYSRQVVHFVTTPAIQEPCGFLGTGVMVGAIERERDAFLDQQVRYSSSLVGDASTQSSILGQVESAFNEPSGSGLNSAMTAFFNSFQDLSTHPEDSSSRNSVLQQGALLSESFHRLSQNLTQLRQSLKSDISSKVESINSLSSEISDLDVKIASARVTSGSPNDLLDQRDQKIEELSKLANVTSSPQADGSVIVSLGGMVIASSAGGVTLGTQEAGNQIQVITTNDNIALNVSSGELGGVLKQYNVSIPKYQDQLNQVASTLISSVNTLHRAGYGLGTPPSTGNDFFIGTDAATIDVNPALTANVSNVAASGSGTAGDNSVALAIANVQGQLLMNTGSETIAQFYSGMASNIGIDINSVDSTVSSQNLILDQLENQRSAISGVSLDEEMTNLIQFQRGYDAAARLVTTTNEMFQTVIAMVQ